MGLTFFRRNCRIWSVIEIDSNEVCFTLRADCINSSTCHTITVEYSTYSVRRVHDLRWSNAKHISQGSEVHCNVHNLGNTWRPWEPYRLQLVSEGSTAQISHV